MAEEKGKQKAPKAEKKAAPQSQEGKIVVIRVRGRIRLLTKIKDTLDMMRLYKKNYCVLLENTPANKGMVQKAKDFVTWGIAEDKLIEELFEKRGRPYNGPLTDSKKKIDYKGRYVEYNGKKYSKFFALNPPRGGFGRKGIKRTFAASGAVGDRGKEINDFVRKMI